MIIDSFLYALGFKADLSAGQSFAKMLELIDEDSQSASESLLGAITAGNLLADALEKAAEGVKEFGADFIQTAEHLENTRITMESLYTTAAEGDEKFQWLWKFAQQNPVMGFDAAQEVFMALKNNGIDPTTESLKAFGDAAAAVPDVAKMIPQGVAELIEGRYASGGVLSPLINLHGAGKNKVYEGNYVNKAGEKVEVKLDFNKAKEATDQLVAALQNKFGGTMQAHADTFFGLIQQSESQMMAFQNDVMSSSVFETLKEQIGDVLEEWKKFTTTQDYTDLVTSVASFGTQLVQIFGLVIKFVTQVIKLFSAWFGSANSIAILLGTMFAAAKWGTIIKMIFGVAGAFRDVYAALQLVAEGESIVAVMGALMEGVLSPILLVVGAIVAAGVGIAYMYTQWTKFDNGLAGSGMTAFFTTMGKYLSEAGAAWEYLGEEIKKVLLLLAEKAGGLNEADQKELKRLQDSTEEGLGAKMDRAGSDYMKKRAKVQEQASYIGTVHRAHPEWNAKQDLGWIQQNRPADYRRLFMTPPGKKNEASPPPAASKTNSDNSIHIGQVNVKASDFQGFQKELFDKAGMGSTLLNFNTPGFKY